MRASPPPGCQKGYPLCPKVDIPFAAKWISPLTQRGYPFGLRGGGLFIVAGGVVDDLGYDLCFATVSETSSLCWQTTSGACRSG